MNIKEIFYNNLKSFGEACLWGTVLYFIASVIRSPGYISVFEPLVAPVVIFTPIFTVRFLLIITYRALRRGTR